MLRTGIILLLFSSAVVIGRCTETIFVATPVLKLTCLVGLALSLICFTATYIKISAVESRRRLLAAPHMVKSREWKLAYNR